MSFKLKSIIWVQSALIVILSVSLLFLGGDLKHSRKMSLDQSNYCIKYTSDIIASSRLDLIREQDAHSRTVDKANSAIDDIINRYNVLVARYNKNTGGINYNPLNEYSYRIRP
jgi:capsule polysaccharide export protein KpsC/LpsZ